MHRIELDGKLIKKDGHDYLKKALNFPNYYGKNLDALYDCLTENNQFEFQILPSENIFAGIEHFIYNQPPIDNENWDSQYFFINFFHCFYIFFFC